MGYRKEKKEDREPDPVLSLRRAHLKAKKVIEKEEAQKGDKTYAPQVSILWRILDDGAKGEHNDKTFWDGYSFVQPYEGDGWVIRSGCRIGDLAEFIAYDLHDRADFFNDDVDIDFEADLDGIEVVASLEPKRFKPTDPPTGTRTVSATLQLAEKAKKAASSLRQKQEAVAAKEAHNAEDDEEDFESIPW